jgi:hypothetical protein
MPMWRSIDSRMMAKASGITSVERSFLATMAARISCVRLRSCSSDIAATLGSNSLIWLTIER